MLGQFRRVGQVLLVAEILDLLHRLRAGHQFGDGLLGLAFQFLIELHVDIDREGLVGDRDAHRLELGDEGPLLRFVSQV